MTYEEAVNVILTSEPDAWLRTDRLGARHIVYKGDLNLRFDMLPDELGLQCDDFREPWARRHPNPKAVGRYFDLFYGASLLRRCVLVSVDGGRAMLPLPHTQSAGLTDQVSLLDYKVAVIQDGKPQNVDEYLQRSGLKVSEDSALRIW